MATRQELAELAPADVIDALDEGVLVARADGTIVRTNPALRAIYGLEVVPATAAELRAALDARHMDGSPVAPADSLSERARRGVPANGRYRVRRPADGREIVVDARSGPIRGPGGEVAGFVVAVHDVTAAIDADREREEFVSIVSHELKTPLTPLKALAQLIRARARRSREGTTPLDLDSLERNLATIERQVDRMNALVNDLLEVSRAGRGTFQLDRQELDLARVVRDTAQRYVEATAEEGRHRFTVDVPGTLVVTGDQPRLEHVTWDLIGNAVKFSPRGGTVTVRLRDDGAFAVLSIEDEGIGIDPADIPNIGRRPFQRGTGKAAGFSGMGLGIYLSRIVAEGHSGTLELSSEGDGKGTTVTVRLPKG